LIGFSIAIEEVATSAASRPRQGPGASLGRQNGEQSASKFFHTKALCLAFIPFGVFRPDAQAYDY
jgi:hypothetical protein